MNLLISGRPCVPAYFFADSSPSHATFNLSTGLSYVSVESHWQIILRFQKPDP